MTGVLTTINAHMRRVYKSWRFGAHVVLLGNVNYLNCTAFIDEVRAVLMGPPPSRALPRSRARRSPGNSEPAP